MSPSPDSSIHESVASRLIAVDIGNSRMKLGLFLRDGNEPPSPAGALHVPSAMTHLSIDHATGRFEAGSLKVWCDEQCGSGAEWRIASVHRGAADRLAEAVNTWAKECGVANSVRRLTYKDVPLTIHVDQPERVGIDRLMAALAADRLRTPGRAAIVVDLGTAITVDLVDADGAFCGGAILPGIGLSARALEEHTDALPRVAMEELGTPPAPVGTSTVPAIEAGLYWGAVGAVRELIARISKELATAPEVFLTGGASEHVAELLAADGAYSVRHVPHLVLSGIALVAS